jgi:alpha-ribazole phosphatase
MTEARLYPNFPHPASGMTRLVLVRHGQTSGNADGLLHGRTDLPLNEVGIQQAQRVASRIRELFEIDHIVSSPLQRASATAGIIGKAVEIEHSHDERLQEMDFGDFEGISVDVLLTEHPDLAAKAFDPENADLAWPNGESRSGFHTRVRGAFTRLAFEYDGKSVVVVSHGGVLGSFLAQVQGGSPDDWQTYRMANCSISSIEIVASGTIVHCVNDCDHLDGLVSMIAAAPAAQ